MKIRKKIFGFLTEQNPLVDPVHFGDGKQVITTKGEQLLCSPLRFDTSSVTPCNHEEANTRILVHAADVLKTKEHHHPHC